MHIVLDSTVTCFKKYFLKSSQKRRQIEKNLFIYFNLWGQFLFFEGDFLGLERNRVSSHSMLLTAIVNVVLILQACFS